MTDKPKAPEATPPPSEPEPPIDNRITELVAQIEEANLSEALRGRLGEVLQAERRAALNDFAHSDPDDKVQHRDLNLYVKILQNIYGRLEVSIGLGKDASRLLKDNKKAH